MVRFRKSVSTESGRGAAKQILLQIDSLSSGGAAAQSTSGDQSGAAASTTPTADAGTANAGAPVKSGNANTDYNAAIALVQDKSRQDDAMVAFQNFIKITLIQLTCQTPIIGWVS